MKKFLLFCAALLLSVSAFAQFDTDWYYPGGRVVTRVGYSLYQKEVVGDITASFETGFLRLQLETGTFALGRIGPRRRYVTQYFAPSLGVVCGSKHLFYLLAGATNWPILISEGDVVTLRKGIWHAKLDAGFDIRLNDLFFINLGGTYVFPNRSAEFTAPSELSFFAGIGFYI